jgi:hypothetical protein
VTLVGGPIVAMIDWRMGKNSLRRYGAFALIPLSQLVAAGLNLGLWAVVSNVVQSDDQAVLIEAYAFAAVASLPASLGIPTLLPSVIGRGSERQSNSEQDPTLQSARRFLDLWVLILVLLAAVCVYAGISEMLTSAGVVLALTALLVRVAMLQQLMRLKRRAIGFAGVSIIPLIIPASALVQCAAPSIFLPEFIVSVAAATVLLSGLQLRRSAVPARELWVFLRRSLLLVPHLACFGLLLQAPRFLAAFDGDTELLLQAHYLTLVVGGGMTLVQSIHGVLVVSVQQTPFADLMARVYAATRSYCALEIAAPLVVAGVSVTIAPIVFDGYPALNLASTVMGPASVLLVVVYLFFSGIALRFRLTFQISLASALAATVLVGSVWFWPLVGINDLMTRFVIALLMLAAFLIAAIAPVVKRRSMEMRSALAHGLLLFCAVGQLTLSGLATFALIQTS